MKILIQHSFFIWLSLLLGACCTLECIAPLTPSQPYGAHFIKEGMTKESRRVDIVACGAYGNESVNFSPSQIQAAKHPNDPNDFKAEERLNKQWSSCMRAKGYVYLEYCDARCQYP
ncbi:MAG: hypothetical protein Q7T88_05870 [Methylotenera sp.]|nr:hypothetical protein [Methylotenera sp.]